QDCVIRNFSGRGFYSTPSASTRLSMSDTFIADNGSDGILIFPPVATAVIGVLQRVEVDSNGGKGNRAGSIGGHATTRLTVSDSVVAHNAGNGIVGESDSSGALTLVTVRNTTIAENLGTGLYSNLTSGISPNVKVFVTRSTITGNGTGLGQSSAFALVFS